MNALKACWAVRAGVIPGTALADLTREWDLTSGDLDGLGRDARDDLFAAKALEAANYALALQDPRRVNWVTLEFLWL